MDRKFCFLIIIFFFFFSLTFHTVEVKGGQLCQLNFSRNFPSSFFFVYEKLYSPDFFPLLGKMLTLFPSTPGQGYQLSPLSNNSFALKGANTIQDGSFLTIKNHDEKGFSFDGDLLLKQLITFNALVEVTVTFTRGEDSIKTVGCVIYSLPPTISGINSLFLFFTGKDLIQYEMIKFLDDLFFLAINLEKLSPENWYEIVADKEKLSGLAFPVYFDSEEIYLVGSILEKINPAP